IPSVQLRYETSIEEIGEGYVLLQKQGDFERLEGVSSVVIGGRVANNTLYEQLVQGFPDLEIYNIGDSVEPRDVYHASAEAAEVAEKIRLQSGTLSGTHDAFQRDISRGVGQADS